MSDEDDEKRQRQMDFIVETLARLTVTVERTAEMQAQHIEETKRRDDELTERIRQTERRDDEASERIARFERSYVVISNLLVSHDEQLVEVTEGLNRLTVVVERYIAARGNSTNGA